LRTLLLLEVMKTAVGFRAKIVHKVSEKGQEKGKSQGGIGKGENTFEGKSFLPLRQA